MVPGMLEGRWDRDQGSPNLAEVTSANLGQPQPTSANFPSTNPVEPPRPTSANLSRPQFGRGPSKCSDVASCGVPSSPTSSPAPPDNSAELCMVLALAQYSSTAHLSLRAPRIPALGHCVFQPSDAASRIPAFGHCIFYSRPSGKALPAYSKPSGGAYHFLFQFSGTVAYHVCLPRHSRPALCVQTPPIALLVFSLVSRAPVGSTDSYAIWGSLGGSVVSSYRKHELNF
ncbi:hypothetical protein B0H13DRAFT_2308158 [Mycena leptocephala]|nr:hypothetical protein B0H13DRAFT_2308158 [Mycena leptocephala]